MIVGSAAGYSPDGTRFAFSARPADDSSGPDVYVWRVGDRRAKAVTGDHDAQLAGWIGGRLLVSRVVDGKPRTAILDLADDTERAAGDGAMWRPTVGPGRETAAWWDGTVRLADDGQTWVPDRGKLVLGDWPNGGEDTQVLADGSLTDWDVQWSDSGDELAVWVTRDDAAKLGKLSLFTVDPATGRVDLAHPKLDAEPAFAGFALKPGRLAWSAPADGGDTSVEVLGWDGELSGRVSLPATDGGGDPPLTARDGRRTPDSAARGPRSIRRGRVSWGTLRRSCDGERSSRSRPSSPRSHWPACRFLQAREHPRPTGPWIRRPLPQSPSQRTPRRSALPVCPSLTCARRATSRPTTRSWSPARRPTARPRGRA